MKLFKKLALGAALMGSLLGAAPSYAIYWDPTKIVPEADCSATTNLCTIRATVNWNDANIGGGVWWATLPKNAYVMAVDFQVTTAFNAGTNNNLTIGATKTGTDYLASTSVASTGVTHATSAAGLALQATSVAGNQTAINSGVPVYVRYVQTGTAATAGVVTIVMTYALTNGQ